MIFLSSFPRLLEEGNIEEAEVQKQRIEKLQRERRRVLEENGVEHQPRFFRFVPRGGGKRNVASLLGQMPASHDHGCLERVSPRLLPSDSAVPPWSSREGHFQSGAPGLGHLVNIRSRGCLLAWVDHRMAG